MAKYGIVVQKKEMTKMWIDNAFTAVTVVAFPQQEVLRYKTQDVDGYAAMVVWVNRKGLTQKKKGNKVSYSSVTEFPVHDDFVSEHKEGSSLGIDVLANVEEVSFVWTAKGKWFQWVMKRFHAKWWPKTHGSKFHRQVGSMGNRKPRRTQKGHPHAGRMGGQQVTLKNIKIVDIFDHNGQQHVAVKGSLPWSYNSYLKVVVS